ncbi:hypothetical protein AVV48_gp18 [Acinetobacter phage phiAC-1]|uniref:hypothetical protein n=1 Tax=Acinetobacter phage phiAC-1 TaxID=1229760 RepID=UPI00028AF6F5|nr:hypothetical protein AVV48_gp18 [Acinetobacter phage phiAC-1]AFU62267.1 hypothetical protein phiAC-1_0018 [Acinetobacter phage phiAC-1]
MSKLEYLNPKDWSLHVIDGENEGAPEGWVLVPEGKNVAYKCNVDNVIYFTKLEMGYRDFDLVWTRKMKEYLVERDGKYELVEAYHLDGGIEVPEGAEIATACKLCIYFWKPSENKIFIDSAGWSKYGTKSICTFDYYLENSDVSIIWKRNPSLNDQEKIETANGYGLDRIGNNIYGTRSRYEGESDSFYRNYLMNFGKPKPLLNDQCAEIEKVRQDSNVSNPKHYTSHPSGIECIEITRHHDFAIGNAIKYLWRAGLKDSDNEIQDLEKAVWYIQDKIKQLRGGK